MFMKNNIKAFTLVELIVVITILAILWTVAFLSLQEYTTLARNSIRIDGISKISSAIQIKKQSWINMLSFVNTGNEIPNIQIWGTTALAWDDYKAWPVNTSAMELKSTDFIDPSNDRSFIIWATVKKWWEYQVVATLEQNGKNEAQISWTYKWRTVESIDGSWTTWTNSFTLTDLDNINKLFKWDIITWVWVPSGTKIDGISDDGMTLKLSNNFTSNTTGIELWSNESVGLVVSTDGTTPVTRWSEDVAYEVLN